MAKKKNEKLAIFTAENTKAVELLGDLIEPASIVFGDEDVKNNMGNFKQMIITALKKHPDEVVEIMAICEGVPVEEYHANLVHIINTGVEIISSPELTGFFTPPGQTGSKS